MERTEMDEDSSALSGNVAELSQTLAFTNLLDTNSHCGPTPPPVPKMPIPVPQSLPTTMTQSYSIQNVPTHAFCQVFSDRIVVGITQLPSCHIGNWISCQATMSPVDPKAMEWDVATLLGNHDDPLLEVYARRVVDCIIQRQCCIPGGTNHIALLLGISLQQRKSSFEVDQERFNMIVKALVDLIRLSIKVILSKSNN
jgi:Proteasome assembly chaperone 3